MRLKSKNIAKNRLLIAAKKAANKQDLTSKENRSLRRLLVALGGPLLICSIASCGFNASFCQGNGCKMNADFATGVIAETKNPASKKSSYWQARENDTNRLTWMESLFGPRGQ